MDLTQAVERLNTARPALRAALHESAVATAFALTEERNRVEALLEQRWAWLDAHPEHPQFVEREDAVLGDLATYEQMEDALRSAADVLFGRGVSISETWALAKRLKETERPKVPASPWGQYAKLPRRCLVCGSRDLVRDGRYCCRVCIVKEKP
jgi:hypothetical protein